MVEVTLGIIGFILPILIVLALIWADSDWAGVLHYVGWLVAIIAILIVGKLWFSNIEGWQLGILGFLLAVVFLAGYLSGKRDSNS